MCVFVWRFEAQMFKLKTLPTSENKKKNTEKRKKKKSKAGSW